MVQLTSGQSHRTTPLVPTRVSPNSFPQHPQKNDHTPYLMEHLRGFSVALNIFFRRIELVCRPKDKFIIRLARTTTKHTWTRRSGLWPVSLMLAALWCVLSVPAEAATIEITILKSSDLKAYNDAIDGFKATAPGGTTYTEYHLRGDSERGRQLARKIRASAPSLVVAVGLKAALAAKIEIVDTPILYLMILDPLKHQLTTANMTGVLLDIPTDRQFKITRAFLPTLRHIGMLYDPDKTATKLKEAEPRAAGHDFQLRGFPVENEKEVPQQLRTLLSESEALWLVPDSTVLTDESIRFILESALTKQVPVIGFSSELTRLGALLSMSIDYRDIGRETGLLAKRILDGEKVLPLKPLPVQRIKISVNLKTARYLGITITKELEGLIAETY